MTWLTWRQLRLQASLVWAASIAFAVVLLATAHAVHALPKANLYDAMTGHQKLLLTAGDLTLAIAPIVIGMFWGAPLVAREVEAGTHRLIWNQSVSRTRWFAYKLGITVLAAAAAVGAVTGVVTWWAGPLDGAQSEMHGSFSARLSPVVFWERGIAPVGYVVFAVTVGALLGALLRRTVGAMAATLVLVLAVQIFFPHLVRPHLARPTDSFVSFASGRIDGISVDGSNHISISVNTPQAGTWTVTNRTVNASGHPVGLPKAVVSCLTPPHDGEGVEIAGNMSSCFAMLNRAGYRQELTYFPADRFWTLQVRETLVFLLLSAGLAGLTLRRVTRLT